MIEREKDSSADPMMVDTLVNALGVALEEASTPETTTADLCSAAFTLLSRVLKGIKNTAPPEDLAYNTQEIRRILLSLIDEFGSTVQ